jgi:hypothetical protein
MMLTWTRPNAATFDETANIFGMEHVSERFMEACNVVEFPYVILIAYNVLLVGSCETKVPLRLSSKKYISRCVSHAFTCRPLEI